MTDSYYVPIMTTLDLPDKIQDMNPQQQAKALGFDDSQIPHTDFEAMLKLAADRIALCRQKDMEYGASWCKRLGPGAFFTTTRKIDRLETQALQRGYDVFDISEPEGSTEGLDETLLDAVAYFLLIVEKRQAKRKKIVEFAAKKYQAEVLQSASEVNQVPNQVTVKTDINSLPQN